MPAVCRTPLTTPPGLTPSRLPAAQQVRGERHELPEDIARNQRIRHRSERHRARQRLGDATGPVDPEAEALAEARLRRMRRGSRWRKLPDAALGAYVEETLLQRVRTDSAAAASARRRVAKVRRSTAPDPPRARRKG